MVVALCVSCSGPPSALQDGAGWVTTEPPPELAGKVSRYEQVQSYGERNDPHGWRKVVRWTLRADVPGPDAGCSFTGWLAGTWSIRSGNLAIDGNPDAGSLEVHDCPDGRPGQSRPNPHFGHAESPFRLEDRTLWIERQFGATPPHAVTLRRAN